MQIPPCIQHIFDAVIGWLELDAPEAANEELDRLPPQYRAHRQAIYLRCLIYCHSGRWEECSVIAEGAVKTFPQDTCFHTFWARAEQRKGRKENAFEILLRASECFPESTAVAYGLSCVAACLNRIPDAEKWLSVAICKSKRPDLVKLRALDQPELEVLWSRGHSESP